MVFQKKFNLEGKTALITGAAGLLGKQHASALLELDAHVILTDVDVDQLRGLKKELSKDFPRENISIYKMDVTKPYSIESISKKIGKKGKYANILINNAAINPKSTKGKGLSKSYRLNSLSLEDWNKEISVGLTGAFLCSKIFGEIMSKKGGGVILNIASDLSVISPDQRLYIDPKKKESRQDVKPITYSVIKTGLIGMTRYLSTYWLGKNIRANALSPGGVFDKQDKEFVKRISSLIPLGRMASQDEYKSAVQFLCSDASSYMNGQNIIIDGGRSVW